MNVYSLAGYGEMFADRVRMEAYSEALRRSVVPGSIVIDLGAGTGVMACMAAKLGARKVYAIEPSDAIQVGRQIARTNGSSDRIEFFHGVSQQVHLPELADVLVSDLRGVLPLFTGHLDAIRDARLRLLKPGGAQIPQSDTLWATLVEAPDIYKRHVGPWESNAHGLDLSAGRQRITNTWVKARFTQTQALCDPVAWTRINYTDIVRSSVRGQAATLATREGLAHGLAMWFNTTLFEDIGFSNAPGAPEAIYGQAFFPFLEPVTIAIGDSADVDIRADLVGDDYVWTWNTVIRTRSGEEKARFRQSTFFASAVPAETLRKMADMFVPQLNEDGAIDRFILEQFSYGRSLREVSIEMASRFPHRFPTWHRALDHVARLSVQYSQ